MCVETHREVRVFSLLVEGPEDKSVMLNKSMSIKMHFAAVMWQWQCVGIWVVKRG